MKVVRAALRPDPGAKLNLARGIRAAVAALVPLLTLVAFHRVELGQMTVLGALFISLCDIGDSVRARARVMGGATVAGALVFAVGRTVGDPLWLAVSAITLVTFTAGLLRVYGPAAAAAGLFLNIIFAVGLGIGGGPSTTLLSAAGFVLGGVCALLLALAPAPGRRFQREAVTQPTPPRGRASPPSPEQVRSQLRFDSPVVRFAALRAAGVAVAAGIGWSLGVSYPQWAVVPVLVCTLPQWEQTLVATTRLAIGTVLGAIAAGLLVGVIHDALPLALLAVALMVVALAVVDLSKALWVFFVTIVVLLLASFPPATDKLARLKVIEALIGVAIALVVAYVGAERSRPTGRQGERGIA